MSKSKKPKRKSLAQTAGGGAKRTPYNPYTKNRSTQDRATIGQVITEDDLRAYARCPKFYDFGGFRDQNEALIPKVIKSAFRWIMIDCLRANDGDLMPRYQQAVRTTMSELGLEHELFQSELSFIERKATLGLHHMMKVLSQDKLVLVSGPLILRETVHRTVVTAEIAAVFKRGRANQLFVVHFSPESDVHFNQNDPATFFKISSLAPFVRLSSAGAKINSIAFSISEDGNVKEHFTSSEKLKDGKPYLDNIIKAMEMDLIYPSLPCRISCPYKKDCIPGSAPDPDLHSPRQAKISRTGSRGWVKLKPESEKQRKRRRKKQLEQDKE